MNTNNTQEQIVIMSLGPMFEEAKEKGLWFYHQSEEAGEVWCSPPFLQNKQTEGEYIWPPEHWELRNPLQYMAQLHSEMEVLVDEYNEMARRLRMEQTLDLKAVSSNPAELF